MRRQAVRSGGVGERRTRWIDLYSCVAGYVMFSEPGIGAVDAMSGCRLCGVADWIRLGEDATGQRASRGSGKLRVAAYEVRVTSGDERGEGKVDEGEREPSVRWEP